MRKEKDIIFFLNNDILEKMKMCVNKATPNEACGFVFGNVKQVMAKPEDYQYHYFAKQFHCVDSNHKSPVAFLISDPIEFDKVYKEAALNHKLQLISIFHSHPSGNRPSGTDLNNMKYLDNFGLKNVKNQIWTIMDAKNKKIKGFVYLQKELVQVEVIIEE